MKAPLLDEREFTPGEPCIVPVWWDNTYHQAVIMEPERYWDLDSKSDCVRVLVEGWRKMWVDKSAVVKEGVYLNAL